jgi:photosystem II stability/assembly factor-like uncharacterized protein
VEIRSHRFGLPAPALACAFVCVVIAVAVASLALGAGVGAAAPVSVGRSGWAWSDPQPQGENLNRVVFRGARGYAVGANGTVLLTDDGGAEWVGLASGTSANLSLVQEIEAGVVVVGGGCTLRMSSDAGASFQRLPVNESEAHCASPVVSFSFLSPSVGFIEQDDGTIALTQDGGQTVVPRTAVPLAGVSAGPIAFASATLGLTVDGAGDIYRTTDGAGSWTKVASVGKSLTDVIFANATTAYAVGVAGTMLASADAGETWTAMPLGPTPPAQVPGLSGISCSDATHCLMTTIGSSDNGRVLLRTEDGGATATQISPSTAGLSSVAFSSGTTAVAVGIGGTTVLSPDGGKTFPTQASTGLGGVGPRGQFRLGQSALDVYAPAAAGQVLASTNGGESWSLLRAPTGANMIDVAFPTTSIGYALSETGVLYRSPSAGLSWSILSAGGPPVPAALVASSPSTVLLVGPSGIRRSTDSGASFDAVSAQLVVGHRHHRAVKHALAKLELDSAERAGTAVVAYGPDAIVASSDGGASWSWVPVPFPHESLEALDFVSASNGFAVTAGRLYHTSDAGRHWKELPAVAGAVLAQLAFSSPSEGYVLVSRGGTCESCTVLLHTADAGRSWTPEAMPRKLEFLADGGSVAYASGAGEAGGLFETRDGGLGTTSSSLGLTVEGARTVTAAKLKKTDGTVSLSGRLSPAQGGESIELAYRSSGGTLWHRRVVTASSSGVFATSISGLRASTVFVAQWSGEGAESGAGTPAVTLTVATPKKKRPSRASTNGRRT